MVFFFLEKDDMVLDLIINSLDLIYKSKR